MIKDKGPIELIIKKKEIVKKNYFEHTLLFRKILSYIEILFDTYKIDKEKF